MEKIKEIAPRENIGRETILRFRMQFQAAAYAALEILNGGEVDRVYCDYHDDFVVRRTIDGRQDYHFFQVKTKAKLNHQWDMRQVFSLKKQGNKDDVDSLRAVRDSFAGKLFIHTIEFDDACREVSLLSNVHFDDDVICAITELQSGNFTSKRIGFFFEKFKSIFDLPAEIPPERVKAFLAKFSVSPAITHIGEDLDAFASAARNAIYKHSEIELKQHEVDEIAKSLVTLVMNRSCERLDGVKKEDIDVLAGVGIQDLLGILSISTEVYKTLLAGEDSNAIKTASILQRQLRTAGATDDMIELSSRLKVRWDVWLRSARHIHTEYALQGLMDAIDDACAKWLRAGGEIDQLRNHLQNLAGSPSVSEFKTIDLELLFGGVSAAMVRRGTR